MFCRKFQENGSAEVEVIGGRGHVSSGPTTDRNPDWDSILEHFGFDPKLFEILEPVNVRTLGCGYRQWRN